MTNRNFWVSTSWKYLGAEEQHSDTTAYTTTPILAGCAIAQPKNTMLWHAVPRDLKLMPDSTAFYKFVHFEQLPLYILPSGK